MYFDKFQLDAKTPSLEVYQKYIDQELCDGDPARIQCVCERAVQDNCLHASLWSLYTSFLVRLLIVLSTLFYNVYGSFSQVKCSTVVSPVFGEV